MAAAEQYSSRFVEEILDEVRKMLSNAPVPASLTIKSAIRNMLEMVRQEPAQEPAQASSADKTKQPGTPDTVGENAMFGSLQNSTNTVLLHSEESLSLANAGPMQKKKKSDLGPSVSGGSSGSVENDHWSFTAQCVVCGLDGVKGKFCKRGYKCERCEGHKPWDRANPQPPYGSDPQTVPSNSFSRDFYFPKSNRGIFSNEKDEATFRRQPPLSLGDAHQAPQVKYQVLQAQPVDDQCRQTMKVLRTLVHPNIAYCFGAWADTKRGKCWTLLEQAPTLAEMIPSLAAAADSLSASELSLDTPSRRGRAAPLQALNHVGLPHGDLRPANIIVDTHNVVKLLVFPSPATTGSGAPRPRLPAPYCPPEDEAAPPGAAYTPSFAGDMFTLGVTLSLIAFGPERKPPADEEPSVDMISFLQLVDGMTSPRPETRLTLQNAFLNPLVASVRLVNGVPVETMLTVIHGSEEGARNHERGAYFVATTKGTEGPLGMLLKFLAESGPTFQVVSTSTSCTLYSVKADPRRRRGVSSLTRTPPQHLSESERKRNEPGKE